MSEMLFEMSWPSVSERSGVIDDEGEVKISNMGTRPGFVLIRSDNEKL